MSAKSVLVVASLALSIIIGVVLGGRGSAAVKAGPAAAHRVTIGLSLDTLKEARWAKDRDAFEKRADQIVRQRRQVARRLRNSHI